MLKFLKKVFYLKNTSQRKKFSHLDSKGKATMVSVVEKERSHRVACARVVIKASDEVIEKLKQNDLKKGDAITVAKIAGIGAAKKTSELIPLCHPLPLENVTLDIEYKGNQIRIQSKVECYGKTGVEMEALTAVSVAALTIYDMCKSMDKSIVIEKQGLYSKSGGKSGNFFNSAMEWD